MKVFIVNTLTVNGYADIVVLHDTVSSYLSIHMVLVFMWMSTSYSASYSASYSPLLSFSCLVYYVLDAQLPEYSLSQP